MKWNYDYSQTLWMKMYLAEPEDFAKGTSRVFITFSQALDIIRAIDAMTQGIRKIVYLVGWQGLGHDDCYPEMEVVNEHLKRACDATARDSLWWLFEEAKRYNTVVSFHVNQADAYSDTPCFPELVATNSLVNGKDGKPAVIEVFNGRDAYKVSYKGYYESGLFKRLWDRFCEVTPVRESGTVHIDNFCVAQSLNPYTSVEEEDAARSRMLDYIASLGIDVTSEYTYREMEWRADSPTHPIRQQLYVTAVDPVPEGDWRDAPIRTLGKIPATWWTSNVTAEECEGEARLILHLVNATRAGYGIRPMAWDPAAAEAARLHAEDMTRLEYFSHQSADGRSMTDRLEEAGAGSWSACGENIAKGYWGAVEVHACWIGSPGHRENLLSDEYTRFGAGISVSGTVTNYVEDFYTRMGE